MDLQGWITAVLGLILVALVAVSGWVISTLRDRVQNLHTDMRDGINNLRSDFTDVRDRIYDDSISMRSDIFSIRSDVKDFGTSQHEHAMEIAIMISDMRANVAGLNASIRSDKDPVMNSLVEGVNSIRSDVEIIFNSIGEVRNEIGSWSQLESRERHSGGARHSARSVSPTESE